MKTKDGGGGEKLKGSTSNKQEEGEDKQRGERQVRRVQHPSREKEKEKTELERLMPTEKRRINTCTTTHIKQKQK